MTVHNETSTIRDVMAGALMPLGSGAELASLAQQLRQLQTIGQAATQSHAETPTVLKGSATKPASSAVGQSGTGGIARTIESVVGTGLGLSPLITGALSLFGGGSGSSAPPPLVKFGLPNSIHLNAGVSQAAPGQAFSVDNSQGGVPRPVEAGQPNGTANTQITVQVQAMDSQSFLDRSSDIALAVRQAMLESSVLNDVIREV